MSGSLLLTIALGVLITLAAAWVALAIAILVSRPNQDSARAMVRLLPNVVRLMWAMGRDPTTPLSVRCRLVIALLYNAQPFNLIPDFIPVIGFLDNVVITSWALRSAARRAGPERVAAHWPGSHEELLLVYRLARLDPPPGE